ncbi:MAG: hypothetical protein ACK5RL_01665 [Acidimicrobiales bacterium]
MSFIGTGGEDWVELDLDLFDRSRAAMLQRVLVDGRDQVVAALGAEYEVDEDDGIVFLVIDGRRRYRAALDADDRLIVTCILDPNGPL